MRYTANNHIFTILNINGEKVGGEPGGNLGEIGFDRDERGWGTDGMREKNVVGIES